MNLLWKHFFCCSPTDHASTKPATISASKDLLNLLNVKQLQCLSPHNMTMVGRWSLSVADWLVYTGTSKNGTAFGLQMSQAGFSAHNIEVSLTLTATTSPHTICQHVQQHTLSQFLAHHTSSPQPAIYHSPVPPRGTCCEAPEGLGHSDLGAPDRGDGPFSTSAIQWWGNKTPRVPQGNVLMSFRQFLCFIMGSFSFFGLWLNQSACSCRCAGFRGDTAGRGR